MENQKITLYSLSDYNNALLIPFAIDLEAISTHEEYLEAIQEHLEEITEAQNDGEIREEWIVCDYEGIPSHYVGEYDLDSDYWSYREIMDSTHLPEEAVQAWIEYGNELNQDDMEDAYQGEWSSNVEMVQELLEDCGEIPADLPAYIHIDWEATARDIMMDYFEYNGHYFRNC